MHHEDHGSAIPVDEAAEKGTQPFLLHSRRGSVEGRVSRICREDRLDGASNCVLGARTGGDGFRRHDVEHRRWGSAANCPRRANNNFPVEKSRGTSGARGASRRPRSFSKQAANHVPPVFRDRFESAARSGFGCVTLNSVRTHIAGMHGNGSRTRHRFVCGAAPRC